MTSPKKHFQSDKARLRQAEDIIASTPFQEIVRTAFAQMMHTMSPPADATKAIANDYMRLGALKLIDQIDNIVSQATEKKPLSTALEPEEPRK